MELPGLERLLETCRSRDMGLMLLPPRQHALDAGTRIAGHPLDPVLAAVYARMGKALFASEVAGVSLLRLDDSDNDLERSNRTFQEYTQPGLGLPVFEFAAESYLAYSYATVPALADERGRQPVMWVDRYEEPAALPVASDVDAFFKSYSFFLEALVAHPEHRAPMDSPIIFPWHVPELLARDERLVVLLRAGRFDPLLKKTDEVREWAARILSA